MPQQRAHRVHLRVACGGIAAAAVDLFEDDGGFGDAKARSAVLLGNERGEIARVGQRLHECIRIGALNVELAPVAVWKCFTEIADGAPQVLMQLRSWHAAIILGVT